MPGVSRLAADSLGVCVMTALLTLALMPESEVAAQNASGAQANAAPQDPAGEWRMQARDFANTRYSTLTQINLDTVKRLRVAWTFSDGAAYGHEGAPLVIGSMMYVVAPFPDVAYALDLSKPGSPIKWTFRPIPRRSPWVKPVAMPSSEGGHTPTAS
jgi:glucose dehydrogenase